ncbi:unnamed protein product [Microthlaspi erraticum]|uniref:Factor of DNA methylation 1-5/IDN2 domain-containing protein n=1 Tax=Microthlaspi erraticum TaxID=1685480 RepID=A0A6D2HX86_9BRAS|nr:unnamed protein product [Microthlaspi erraticum]
MHAVQELQTKISDYEKKMLHYESKIGRLENDTFDKDQEIIRAKFTLLEAMPELNTQEDENDPSLDIPAPGHIDPMVFHTACTIASPCKPEEDAMMWEREIQQKAETLYEEWRSEINDGFSEERPDLSGLKEKYGEELYNAIKIAWIEAQESRRTGVHLKPWHKEAGREQTLTELLVPLEAQIQTLKIKNHH